ncbi:MAG: hypothetical protein GC186_19955 [Rhodobacteraceae bacterium]|nr:hypothetical protein [Paracoccaceae bacterium]
MLTRQAVALVPLLLGGCAAAAQCVYRDPAATTQRLSTEGLLPSGCKVVSVASDGTSTLACDGGRVGFSGFAPSAVSVKP